MCLCFKSSSKLFTVFLCLLSRSLAFLKSRRNSSNFSRASFNRFFTCTGSRAYWWSWKILRLNEKWPSNWWRSRMCKRQLSLTDAVCSTACTCGGSSAAFWEVLLVLVAVCAWEGSECKRFSSQLSLGSTQPVICDTHLAKMSCK